MQVIIEDDDLSVTVRLDVEPEWVDLKRLKLDQQILDLIEEEQALTANRECDPDGGRWAPLKPRTIHAKNSDRIGSKTGRMLYLLSIGRRYSDARQVTWTYPADRGSLSFNKAHNFHNGNEHQEARRIIGVSKRTENEIRKLINSVAGDVAWR